MFKVGQKVWCGMFGEGVVTKIFLNYQFPVEVSFSGVKENYTLDGKFQWHAAQTLFPYPVEIVKKVVKPSINWEHVDNKYNFLAQDSTGVAWLYSKKPTLVKDFWDVILGEFALAGSHVSYTPGTCDWKDSLVQRPDVK